MYLKVMITFMRLKMSHILVGKQISRDRSSQLGWRIKHHMHVSDKLIAATTSTNLITHCTPRTARLYAGPSLRVLHTGASTEHLDWLMPDTTFSWTYILRPGLAARFHLCWVSQLLDRGREGAEFQPLVALQLRATGRGRVRRHHGKSSSPWLGTSSTNDTSDSGTAAPQCWDDVSQIHHACVSLESG